MEKFDHEMEFDIGNTGNIDWDIISGILQDETFIINSKNQYGAYSPVYDSGMVLPDDVVNQNNSSLQEFISQQLVIIKEAYPELSEDYLMKAASLCSRHYSDIEASLDRDICVMTITEGVDTCTETYRNALNNLKANFTQYFRQKGTFAYDPLSYSEERVAFLVLGQLQNHLADSNNQLLTWGTARLALSELSKIQIQQEQENKRSISF